MDKLKIIICEEKYWEFIRILRSDPRVQNGFIQKANITKDQQIKYMEKHNNNYYVCLYNEEPCGFIGEIDGDIRICTHPTYHNKGIGTFMIQEFSNIKNDIYAKIKIDNIASIKAFENAGYEKKYYILEPVNKNYKKYEKYEK
jgi:RimJ/RimL family protein N-acetyltransferase